MKSQRARVLVKLPATRSHEINEMNVKIYSYLCFQRERYANALNVILNESGITTITVKDWSQNRTLAAKLAALHE